MSKQQRLSVEQYVEITDWFKFNKDRIEKAQNTQLEASALAEKELGYPVPLTTVQRCAKIAKIQWANSPPPPPPPPIDREAIITLIAALEGLYIETVGSAPKNLVDLKSSYIQDTARKEKIPIMKQIKNPDFETKNSCTAIETIRSSFDTNNHEVGR